MDSYGETECSAQEALLDAMGGPAFFVGRDYRYLAYNKANRSAVRQLYGAEISVGGSLFDAVTSADDRDVLRAALDRALAGETHSSSGWYGGGASDRSYYTFKYAPVMSGGEIVGAAAVAVDATEVRSITEALHRSEEKFEAAFRSSPDAININRLSDGLYLEINTGFTKLTGYTEKDIEGRTSLDLSIWDDPADRQRLIVGLKADGQVDRLEAHFRRKDGSLTTAEMSARVLEIGGTQCILSVTRDISERRRVQDELEASYERLERLSHDVVQTLGRIVETRDPYTQGHEQRSADLCRQIGVQMGLSNDEVEALETAALVHDIGKLGVPAEILTKPGGLSRTEYALIKEHPQNGYEILKDISFDWPIAEYVLQHHERMDGSGYPNGLAADEIQMCARILAVADVVEAMSTDRPYRASLGLPAAVRELRENPSLYDPDVVAAFLTLCDGGCVDL